MEKQHVNVIICTPGHSLMSAYNKSLLATVSEISKMGISWAWSNEYSSHVGDAREVTLSGTFQNDPFENRPFIGNVTYDKLFWIDSDIAWTSEDFLKLYNSDKDIITGAYLLATGEVTAYKKLLGNPYVVDEVKSMTEPVKIESCGFGFLAVKSGIFEKLTRPWFQAVPATGEWNGKDYSFPIMGEDISWCKRVTDLGYEIWFDPTVRVTHHKMMKLTWEGPRP